MGDGSSENREGTRINANVYGAAAFGTSGQRLDSIHSILSAGLRAIRVATEGVPSTSLKPCSDPKTLTAVARLSAVMQSGATIVTKP